MNEELKKECADDGGEMVVDEISKVQIAPNFPKINKNQNKEITFSPKQLVKSVLENHEEINLDNRPIRPAKNNYFGINVDQDLPSEKPEEKKSVKKKAFLRRKDKCEQKEGIKKMQADLTKSPKYNN